MPPQRPEEGNHVLAPDWTGYNRRVRYQEYDVTTLVHPGENVLGALIVNGWYAGHLGNGGFRQYGKLPALLAQLEIMGADGRVERIVTDGTWQVHASATTASDFMLGESCDARLESPGWDRPGFDARDWHAAGVREAKGPRTRRPGLPAGARHHRTLARRAHRARARPLDLRPRPEHGRRRAPARDRSWTIYEAHDDKRILERHLPAMTHRVEWCRAHSVDLLREKDRGSDYGDWLSQGENTPKDVIGTAYFACSTHLLARAYRAVGDDEASRRYEALFGQIRDAFDRAYVAPDGRVKGTTQCGYAMALKFELLPGTLRPRAVERSPEMDLERLKTWGGKVRR